MENRVDRGYFLLEIAFFVQMFLDYRDLSQVTAPGEWRDEAIHCEDSGPELQT